MSDDAATVHNANLPASHVHEAKTKHRPQSLIFAFFGAVILATGVRLVPAAVFLRMLSGQGVAEAAARATLSRMVRKDLLERVQVGRAARYALTSRGENVVRDASVRVFASDPFQHPDGEWTLLSYSLPESRRDLRHQLRATLTWSGFGGLRDGLWIAPGRVDVAAVFAKSALVEVVEHAEWFAASPGPGVRVEGLIKRAWSVDRIRAEHEAFIRTWWCGPHGEDPLSEITMLGADWLRLLRSDPGLPARHISADWPAAQSAAVFRRCYDGLLPAALRSLDSELGRQTTAD